MKTLCVDIGGTGIKTIVLDEAGKPSTERQRVETPMPATPRKVLAAIAGMAQKQGAFDRVSVGFPGVVRDGIVETAPNLHARWTGFRLARALTKTLGKPARVANDADVQGYGAVRGKGVELVITLGTGLGSALFVDGRLVPNLELAHHPFRKSKTYEECLGKAALKKEGRKKWNRLLAKAVGELDRLFNFDRLFIGGGNARKIQAKLPARAKVVPNIAGLIGGGALWRSSDRRQGRR